jgi:putative GTP pyrophosphokinase
MEELTQKILERYEKRYSLYKEFCFSVKNLIRNLLNENGYKYHMQHRLKDIQSLKEKVERKWKQGKKYKRLSEVEDLAAIRVIFYLNSDIEKFVKEVNQEIGGTVKIQNKRNTSGYQAVHLIVSLGRRRLRLNEYKRFKGLKCEIQLTSLLNHAWSEIEHDIFYKKNSLKKSLDKKTLYKEKKKMKEIMGNYLRKANSEFERIIKTVKRK